MIRSGQVQYHDDLDEYMVNIDLCAQHPDNPNNGDLEVLVESILTNGMYRPIIIQAESRYILSGNTTWEACKTLGADTIPIVELYVDDDTALRILLADNETAALARRDPGLEREALERLVANAGGDLAALVGTGYDEQRLSDLRQMTHHPVSFRESDAWPTLSVRLPPQMLADFRDLTHEADNDVERFEVLMRLAGWEG